MKLKLFEEDEDSCEHPECARIRAIARAAGEAAFQAAGIDNTTTLETIKPEDASLLLAGILSVAGAIPLALGIPPQVAVTGFAQSIASMAGIDIEVRVGGDGEDYERGGHPMGFDLARPKSKLDIN